MIVSQFEVSQYEDTYTIYELKEPGTSSRVLVCPERGGIVIGCQLHGEELFYLDKATLEHPTANIRGGNPILFPICGHLKNGSYEWAGTRYEMANHGVARTSPWEVISTSTNSEASITLRLQSNKESLSAYPFHYELEFTYALVGGELHTRQHYRNCGQAGSGAMPFYAGFHPYFAIEGSKSIPYDTDATRYVDYNDNVVKPYTGVIDLNNRGASVCLLDAERREIAFPIREGVKVRMRYDDPFKYVVLWSVIDHPFICVEPWMAETGELNRQEELVLLEAGETLSCNLIISRA
ncbi:aldose epimerase family protein [Paenibacillus chungangensis]|uniref:Aldose epimerase n=1 Tax=Paenibacillus chungangensis TaxID=696535 RepID=A0ABW3HQP3_9BACL